MVKTISLLHIVQTGPGAHTTPNLMGTGGSFPRVKKPGREANYTSLTSVEVKKMCVCIYIYIYSPISLHGVVLN
jgi:hypothetical protein